MTQSPSQSVQTSGSSASGSTEVSAATRGEILQVGKRVVADEAAALNAVSEALDATFAAAVETLRDATQVVVSGVGKSGDIGRKIAATLTSTGTPAIALHPVDALHGDLGIVTPKHVLLALSRSGNTEELLRFVLHFRRLGGPVIAITQGTHSKLAEVAQHVLPLPDLPEAGPLNLAPTTSCMTTLGLGDALAMALLHARGFAPEDFASFHPEGSLGRRLLLRADDLMHQGEELPRVSADAPFRDVILAITAKKLGLTLVEEADGTLVGTVTDGDLRRVFERVDDPRTLTAREVHRASRRDPEARPVRTSCVGAQIPAIECLQLMRESRISALVVVDLSGRAVGVLRLLDLIDAGLS